VIWFAPFQGLGDDDLVVRGPRPKGPPRPRDEPPLSVPQQEGEPERPPARASMK
jgi:hypothetical protein